MKQITAINPKDWNRMVSHPLQSWEWGEFRKKTGVDVVRLDGWQITFHRLPHLPFTIGYFPKGPEMNEKMINFLKKIGKQKNAIFIQLEPNILNSQPTRFAGASARRATHNLYNPIIPFSPNILLSLI